MTEQASEYDGHCAFAVSIGKMEVMGEKNTSVKNGKTYVFSNPVAKLLFSILPNRAQKADENWKKHQQK